MFVHRKNLLAGVVRLSRYSEYYGSIIFCTGLGLAVSQTKRPLLIAGILIANLLAVSFSFAFNDIMDADEDALDSAKAARNPVSASLISAGIANLVSIAAAVSSLTVYAFLGLKPFIFGVATIIVAFLYSWRVTRLKSRPIVDILAHSLHLGPFQVLAAIYLGSVVNSSLTLRLAFFVFLLSALAALNNEIRDYDIDRRTKLRNTLSILNLYRLGSIVQYLWLVPVILIILSLIDHIESIGQGLIVCTIILAVIIYALSPPTRRREIFFYRYSQILGTIFGFIFILFS
ncbi:MAG TPA: UbiA family prenyltransferase [Pyrinomonadaceae bacterium]|nr:UbiA family prenyltransferase [Pyrinomonadaceae bacterium]